MSIRNRVIAVAFGILALLALAQFLVQRELLLPPFAALERKQAMAAMDRVTVALNRQTQTLATFARDWGNWNVTYAYMHDHDETRLRTEFSIGSFNESRANALALIDPDGRIVRAFGFEAGTRKPIVLDVFARPALAANDPLRAALGSLESVTGLLQTDHGPMIVATAPILDGSGQGPAAGMLVFGRLLSVAELALAASLPTQDLRGIAPDELPDGLGTPLAHVPGAVDYVRETTGETSIYREVRDLSGNPVLCFALELPRAITANATRMILVDSLILLLLAAVALIVLMVFLGRAVLMPVRAIAEHALAVGDSDDLSRRLNRRGGDELAALAGAIDHMVERLARTRTDLIEQSFVAGLAEMASGALHNLGNALTPLAVRVSTLGESLRQLPDADLKRVITELESGEGGDPARRADLLRFLGLIGEEVAARAATARADADAAATQLLAIQRILTDQVRKSRAGPVLESVRLPQLIAQSAELVAEAKRARLVLEIDPALERLEPVRLPATMLRQVFQNMIVNAAEAVADFPRRRGRLRISAQLRAQGGRQELHCAFQDDGCGIDPEVLPRLFQRRFSTKSETTNSGIGLHWCANALRAHGGEIRVTSDGPGKGACFHIVVPLKAEPAIAAARAA